jgi:hypothetical protein
MSRVPLVNVLSKSYGEVYGCFDDYVIQHVSQNMLAIVYFPCHEFSETGYRTLHR